MPVALWERTDGKTNFNLTVRKILKVVKEEEKDT